MFPLTSPLVPVSQVSEQDVVARLRISAHRKVYYV
jgi:hypothetical protein